MNFQFDDLDDKTRDMMLSEIQLAHDTGQIYKSTRFNSVGITNWLSWLQTAARSHNEHWLAFQIDSNAAMKDFEGTATPSGVYTVKHVRHDASCLFADGQFNRFYIAAICRRAIDENKRIEIYRACHRNEPRPDSQDLIGTNPDPVELLEQVRDIQKSFKCSVIKPGSGLSVRLV